MLHNLFRSMISDLFGLVWLLCQICFIRGFEIHEYTECHIDRRAHSSAVDRLLQHLKSQILFIIIAIGRQGTCLLHSVCVLSDVGLMYMLHALYISPIPSIKQTSTWLHHDGSAIIYLDQVYCCR